jgi:hypothetical protein
MSEIKMVEWTGYAPIPYRNTGSAATTQSTNWYWDGDASGGWRGARVQSCFPIGSLVLNDESRNFHKIKLPKAATIVISYGLMENILSQFNGDNFKYRLWKEWVRRCEELPEGTEMEPHWLQRMLMDRFVEEVRSLPTNPQTGDIFDALLEK